LQSTSVKMTSFSVFAPYISLSVGLRLSFPEHDLHQHRKGQTQAD